MRAKSIDRLALTRQKFGAKMYGDEVNLSKSTGLVALPVKSSKSTPLEQHREGYSKCPSCGQETLIHEDGCMHCRSYGWSACG